MTFRIKNILLTSIIILICYTTELYSINPDRNYSQTPDSLNIEYLDLNIETPDNFKLKVWKLYPKNNDLKHTIVLAYGDSGNMSYYLAQADVLISKGFTVVMFDYRGFGKSSDFDMNLDYLYYDEFSTDLATVIKWAKVEIDNQTTGVWGLSMGTVIGSIAYQEASPDFLIMEGLVIDPLLIKERIDTDDLELKLPESANNFNLLQKSISIPVLVFAGKNDELTTVDDAKLFISESDNREIIVFDGGHLEGMWAMSSGGFGQQYINTIVSFINQI